MSYWRDSDFQERLLTAYCRDRNFLKKMAGMLKVEHFRPRKGEGQEEYYIIAQLAAKYYKDYKAPIGGFLKTEVLDYIRENKRKLGSKRRAKLLEVEEKIRKADVIAVDAIEKKVQQYLQRQAKSHAIRELISLQEKGELTDHAFRKVLRTGLEEFDNTLQISNYSDEEEIRSRIKRRHKNRNRKYPYLYIDCFDKNLRTFPRGEYGLILAKYKTGKSTCCVYIAQVMAMQGLNVLFFTLEDSLDMVEDRFDASFAGIKMKKLYDQSNRLKRRLKRKLQMLRAKIKIIDGTDGEMTMQRMDEIWENYRNQGFNADVIIVDYDEGVKPADVYKGDSGERRQLKEIHKDFKTLNARRDTYGWMAAQTKRGKSGQRKMIVMGDDNAEDISKAKRCAMLMGIGDGPEGMSEDARTLGIPHHRYDKGGKHWTIVGDYARAIFYSKELTMEAAKERDKHKHHDD